MKIRTGFVSNSSSSSFVAYGIEVDMYGDEKEYMTECLKNYINNLDVDFPLIESSLWFTVLGAEQYICERIIDMYRTAFSYIYAEMKNLEL